MSFAIVAEFPLGTYRGHVGEGELDRWPSPARLHAALLAAAGQGTRAVEVAGVLSPDGDARAVLSWLEGNPPDGLALPLHRVNPATNSVFRDIGQLRPKMLGTKRINKRDSECVALGASIMWIWETDPPTPVRDTLDELCPDVPYLGQADSPVRLRIESAPSTRPTHRWDRDARLSTARRSDVEMSVARPGRASALVTDRARRDSAPPPRPAADRAKTDEDDLRSPVTTAAVGRERYVPNDTKPGPASPWAGIWVLPIADDPARPAGITLENRVRWSVALHRALIAIHGDGAPSVLTGHYGEGVSLPANRVAIHVVDRDPAMAIPIPARQAFVVAIPPGVDPGDLVAVGRSVASIRVVRSTGGSTIEIDVDAQMPTALSDGSAFWLPPEQGLARCWTTTPAVPGVRPPRGRGWSEADAVTLSVALTWRDVLTTDHIAGLGRDERFRALVDAARVRGVEVYDVRPLSTSRVDRYVHKVSEGLVVQPYIGILSLGDLVPEGRVWASIGQSRHLGGGLLLPIDVAEPVLDVWRHR
jgi:CRISPR-associated protein Csb2